MPDGRAPWPNGLRTRASASRTAPLLALGVRLKDAARYDAGVLRRSAAWVWRSREFTNYTYDLTDLNMEHLCWWVAAVTDLEVALVRPFVQELLDDEQLASHVRAADAQTAAGGARFGRRCAWYAILRISQPDLVVEAGTHHGLGSLAIAAALIRNGRGRLVTIDTNPACGRLVRAFDEVVSIRIGASLDIIPTLAGARPVDVFIHDSLHSYDYEAAELAAVEPLLSSDAVILSDNAHNTRALSDWAQDTGRNFLFFAEEPTNHWYPGGGVGAAWTPRSSS